MKKTDIEPAVWFPTIRCGTGTDVFTVRLAEGLQKRGIRAEICWLPHRAEYAPWTVPIPKPPAWANIVHINSWLPPRFVPKHTSIVVTIHHNVHGTPGRTVLQRLYHLLWIRAIEKANFSKATVLTTVSNFSARSVAASFGPLKIVTIHNGIDLNLFYPSNRQSPSHPFRLIFVGTWSRRKGCDLVGPIMQHLGPDFELIHTGRPKLCSPNVRAVGFLNEQKLLELYQQADALLLPSRLEGFGQVALEAMACGVPTIATRGSALTELIEDGVTGILCGQNDIHAFVNAAKRLAGNPDLWRNMRVAAQKRAKQNFSIHAMVDRYLGLYQLALDKNLSDNKF